MIRKTLLVGIFSLTIINVHAKCIAFPDLNEPSTYTTFSGYFITQREWGPPNYGEDPKTDSQFTALLLKLDKPVVFCGTKDDPQPTILDCIQVIDPNCTAWNSRLYSQHVAVYGDLWPATFGEQITPVVMGCEKRTYDDHLTLSAKEIAQLKSYDCQSSPSMVNLQDFNDNDRDVQVMDGDS